MGLSEKKILFPYKKAPAPGSIIKVADGLFWARMPLPMLIDHVNVYILEGCDGLSIIDTGLNFSVCRSAWITILKKYFDEKPVKKVLITHHHPDHIGLLGWFANNYDIKVYASRSSWLLARMLCLDTQDRPSKEALDFWKKSGMDKETFDEKSLAKPFNFVDGVAQFPLGFQALNQGDEISLGDKNWRVEIGQGHAPDHITLWGLDCPIIFSGDQIIAGISSNLGVYPTEPLLDTVGLWLDSCQRFLALAEPDHLVLPGHKLPFLGAAVRLEQLIQNHHSALDRIKVALSQNNCTAVDLFKTIFNRDIKKSEYSLAMAEAVGHINYFRARDMLKCNVRSDGGLLFKLK